MPFLDGIVFTTLTLTTAGEVYSAKDEKLGKSFESIPEKEKAVDEIKKNIKQESKICIWKWGYRILMEKTKYNENQSVFKVGELPDKMYLLVKGSVGIFLPTNETKKPNFIIQENELFGEMGVIENELRMATARCLVESEIISITKDEFDKRVNNSDVFVKGCLKALSYRLRSVEKKM